VAGREGKGLFGRNVKLSQQFHLLIRHLQLYALCCYMFVMKRYYAFIQPTAL